MIENERPSLAAFLAASESIVAQVAPTTVMFAAGGTRRDAVLHGIPVDRLTEKLAAFSIYRFYQTVSSLFRLGVQHVFALTVHGKQLNETGPYRDYILEGVELTVGTLGYPYYEKLGCRVRLVGHEEVPELASLAAKLDAKTGMNGPQTIWWLATLSNEAVWKRMIAAGQGATTRAEVARRYFGVDVPAAQLFISFGKPFFSPEIMPLPLIGDETHCYFYQRPGYYLSEREIRTLIYDYVYLRHTWLPDKNQRYAEVEGRREMWERNYILGLGQRIGSFWYPLIDQEDIEHQLMQHSGEAHENKH